MSRIALGAVHSAKLHSPAHPPLLVRGNRRFNVERAHFARTNTATVDPAHARAWPWEKQAAVGKQLDAFNIKPAVPADQKGGKLAAYYNRLVYDRVRARLPGKGAPGPDGVHNEVLRHLPEAFHAALHRLFVQLWALERTPDAWKRALTILLYKKDDPHNVANYRPIGLLNSVYKMWTSAVTMCMTSFVEEHNVLSDTQ